MLKRFLQRMMYSVTHKRRYGPHYHRHSSSSAHRHYDRRYGPQYRDHRQYGHSYYKRKYSSYSS